MISKIYKSKHKSLFEAGKGKGRKRPNRQKVYKEAVYMSRLSPSIKRVVKYKKTK